MSYEIPNGLQVEDLIEIKGRVHDDGEKLIIELSTPDTVSSEKQLAPDQEKEHVPFKLSLYTSGEWVAFGKTLLGEDSKQGNTFPLPPASEFVIRIIAFQNHFQVYIGQIHVVSFEFLIPLTEISHLVLVGDADYQTLEFLDSHEFLDSVKEIPRVLSPFERQSLMLSPLNTLVAGQNFFGERSAMASGAGDSVVPQVSSSEVVNAPVTIQVQGEQVMLRHPPRLQEMGSMDQLSQLSMPSSMSVGPPGLRSSTELSPRKDPRESFRSPSVMSPVPGSGSGSVTPSQRSTTPSQFYADATLRNSLQLGEKEWHDRFGGLAMPEKTGGEMDTKGLKQHKHKHKHKHETEREGKYKKHHGHKGKDRVDTGVGDSLEIGTAEIQADNGPIVVEEELVSRKDAKKQEALKKKTKGASGSLTDLASPRMPEQGILSLAEALSPSGVLNLAELDNVESARIEGEVRVGKQMTAYGKLASGPLSMSAFTAALSPTMMMPAERDGVPRGETPQPPKPESGLEMDKVQLALSTVPARHLGRLDESEVALLLTLQTHPAPLVLSRLGRGDRYYELPSTKLPAPLDMSAGHKFTVKWLFKYKGIEIFWDDILVHTYEYPKYVTREGKPFDLSRLNYVSIWGDVDRNFSLAKASGLPERAGSASGIGVLMESETTAGGLRYLFSPFLTLPYYNYIPSYVFGEAEAPEIVLEMHFGLAWEVFKISLMDNDWESEMGASELVAFEIGQHKVSYYHEAFGKLVAEQKLKRLEALKRLKGMQRISLRVTTEDFFLMLNNDHKLASFRHALTQKPTHVLIESSGDMQLRDVQWVAKKAAPMKDPCCGLMRQGCSIM